MTAGRLGGAPLRAKGIVLHAKGDWAEFCERLGFPSHASGFRPCFCCNASGDALYDPVGVSLISTPWHNNLEQDYEEAAPACEVCAVMSAEAHATIKRLLRYDKRTNSASSFGRALTRGVAELGLRTGDRLEPCESLPDVVEFEHISVFPAKVLFWRPSKANTVHHRCPLWQPEFGLTPARSIAIDLLHSYYLGPLQVWARESCWMRLESGIWKAPGHTEKENIVMTVSILQRELFSFYAGAATTHPGEDISKMAALTAKMLGVGGKSKRLKSKAKETWGLALFLLRLLPRHVAVLGERGASMLAAGHLLVDFLRHLKRCGDVLAVPDKQAALDF